MPGLRNGHPVFSSSVSLTSSICEFTIGPRTPYLTFSPAPGRGIPVIFVLGNEQGPKRLSYLPTSSGEMTEDQHEFEHIHLPYVFLSHTALHCRVTKDSHLHRPQAGFRGTPSLPSLRLSSVMQPPVLVWHHTASTQPLRPVSLSSGPARADASGVLVPFSLGVTHLAKLTPADVNPTPNLYNWTESTPKLCCVASFEVTAHPWFPSNPEWPSPPHSRCLEGLQTPAPTGYSVNRVY